MSHVQPKGQTDDQKLLARAEAQPKKVLHVKCPLCPGYLMGPRGLYEGFCATHYATIYKIPIPDRVPWYRIDVVKGNRTIVERGYLPHAIAIDRARNEPTFFIGVPFEER